MKWFWMCRFSVDFISTAIDSVGSGPVGWKNECWTLQIVQIGSFPCFIYLFVFHWIISNTSKFPFLLYTGISDSEKPKIRMVLVARFNNPKESHWTILNIPHLMVICRGALLPHGTSSDPSPVKTHLLCEGPLLFLAQGFKEDLSRRKMGEKSSGFCRKPWNSRESWRACGKALHVFQMRFGGSLESWGIAFECLHFEQRRSIPRPLEFQVLSSWWDDISPVWNIQPVRQKWSVMIIIPCATSPSLELEPEMERRILVT